MCGRARIILWRTSPAWNGCGVIPWYWKASPVSVSYTHLVDMPEEWKAGIFLPRFGLHIANTEHGVFTDYGYLVKSGDEWQRVHEGQPVPEEYRVMAYPAPEILRDEAPARTVQPEAAPAAEAAASPPVVPIIFNSQKSADRMKEITDRLETGIQELFESERYKAYLLSLIHI